MMEYRRPAGEDEVAAFVEILAAAFRDTPEGVRAWMVAAGDDVARVLLAGPEIVAGFIRRPMGQFWGGRSVPMLGVAAVATAAHARGGGVATALMHEAVREMQRDGFALSVLYAASFPLYRRAGFELAGDLFQVTADLVPLIGSREEPMRPGRPEDEPALRALQREIASERNGTIDRSDAMWARQMRIGDRPAEVHVIERAGRIDGYVAHGQREKSGSRELVVRDMVARDEASARRLLGFLQQHQSLVDRALWAGDSADPFVTLLNSRRYEIELRDQWMLRIVDVARALAERGYPAGVEARLDLEIEDDLVASNNGRFSLTVADGRATVAPGGEGRLRASVRGLAPLYSGFLPPAVLRRAGWIAGDDESCAVAASLFGGGAPFMSEQF